MIEMKLYENALSSLDEGLRCWKQGEHGDKERYKFAILHISRFFELALKYAVYCMHPLLVFKKPYSKDLSEATTISPQEAFYILKNSITDSLGDIDFDDEDIKPLLRLKKVRNSIEHFVYDLSPEEIKEDIILFLETATSMISDRADAYFQEHLKDDALKIYCDLTGEE
jgi:hypothetical protein